MRKGLLPGIVALITCAVCAQDSSQGSPFFTNRATYIYLGGSAVSPDRRNTVSLRLIDDNSDDFPSEVKVRTPNGILRATIQFGLNAQVLWSGDSRAFAITGSSEGANGLYHT